MPLCVIRFARVCVHKSACVRLAESSMVDDNTENNKNEKYVFSSQLRLFLLMLNVESILLISMLLFNSVGQLFHKVLPMDVLNM